MTASEKSREWLLDDLPSRNRFLMKRVSPKLLPRPSWARHGWRHRLYLKVLGGHYRMYKDAPPPNTEAIHTRSWPHTSGNGLQGEYPLRMVTPRMACEEAGRLAQARIPSYAVSWGKSVLDRTDGHRINLAGLRNNDV